MSIGNNHGTYINNETDSEELSEIESSLAGNSSTTVSSQTFALDPTLTMDLTTMNPPKGHNNTNDYSSNMDTVEDGDAAGAKSSKEIDDFALTTTKEAESLPSNMDTGPERPSHDDASKTNEKKVAIVGSVNDDDDNSKTSSTGTQEESAESSPAKTSTAKDVSTTLAGSQDRATSFSPTLSPTMKVTPAEILITSSPTEIWITSSPTEMWITSSPTVEYVEPSDDSLDPVSNEKDADDVPFENDEATSPMQEKSIDDEALSLDDWGEDYNEALLKDNEEEVKKGGGWLSVASIILMIYTAYQMSENPDGICAR
jgi:hypothetical protein